MLLRRKLTAIALIAVGAAVPLREARAYDAMVQATVATQAYQLRDASDQLISLRRLDTYLRLFVLDLWPHSKTSRRDENAPDAHFVASLRIRADFGGFSQNWDFSEWGHGAERGFNPAFDLLFAYLKIVNLAGRIDLTLGRQYHLDPLDLYGFDGLKVRVKLPWHLAVEGFWGARISGALAVDAPIFLTEGTDPTDSRTGWMPMVGAALSTRDLRFLYLRVAYRTTWHVLKKQDLGTIYPEGTEAGVPRIRPIEEKIHAWSEISFLKRRLRLYGGVGYNLLLGQVDRSQAGISAQLSKGITLRAEHIIFKPDFDGDSIFNLFNTSPFQEVRLSYGHRFTPRLSGYLRASVRLFSGGEPNAERADERRKISPDAGAGLGVAWRGKRFAARADFYWQEGYGGRTVGFFALWRHTIIPGWLSWEGRGVITWFDDGLGGLVPERASKGITAGLGLGARANLGGRVALHLLLEDNFGTYSKSDVRFFAMMNVSWCTWGRCPSLGMAP